jgi:hypothetical protein
LTVLLSILFNDLLSFSLFFFSLLTLGLSHNGKQETGRVAKDKKEKGQGGKRGEEDLLEINGGSQQNGTGTSLSGWPSLVSSGCPPQMGCFTGVCGTYRSTCATV